MFERYDIIVVGAGHSGCEAAAAAANMGGKVLLITMNLQTIGQMSCNPAMGGIAKGQIVREIDALGGYSGIISDKTALHFRMLNRSKGPAMWSPRTQNDRMLFASEWRRQLEALSLLDMYQDTVQALMVANDVVQGVVTARGHSIYAKTVILTNGTFLNGAIYIGEKKTEGGRMAEKSATGLTEQLRMLGFESARLKTGTPPRLDGRTLDYTKMEIQNPDTIIEKFSFLPIVTIPSEAQKPCWITYTNSEVHEILKTGFATSPVFQGNIVGIGPRYCPSIEDKINRFAERERHQLFVEPEGFHTTEVYLNGFSTSLSEDIQVKALRKIVGLEQCKILKPGYAIEYDYFPPTQLKANLETKLIKNLFFAGQINGTTGYEEAAGQGIMAGINAYRKMKDLPPFILERDEAYIGVLIDDLVIKGTDEPYRMFTSRAEFRTLLRQDNADLRLTEKSYHIGLASRERCERMLEKKTRIAELIQYLKKNNIAPDLINEFLLKIRSSPLSQAYPLAQILLRTEVNLPVLIANVPGLSAVFKNVSDEVIRQVEIQIKYEKYIEKEQELADKINGVLDLVIPEHFQYDKVQGLASEAKEKLKKIGPRTLKQASNISGITPGDIQILLIYMGR